MPRKHLPMRIEVTWIHEQGYKYVQRYTSVKRFIGAYLSGKRLDNAVIYPTLEVVTIWNINTYISKYKEK